MSLSAFIVVAGVPGVGSADVASQKGDVSARLSFAILNLFSICSQGVDVLAKCFMTTAAYLAAEAFFKFVPIVGALISMAAALTCIVIAVTKMSRCKPKLEAETALRKQNGDFEAVKEITLYSMVKHMEITMHFIVLSLSIISIGLMFFSGAAFFLPGLIAIVALTIILFIAYQIIHRVCKIDEIERKYALDVPLN